MAAISPPVQSVLELFQGPLASVRFADIDAAGLSSLAADVEAASAEVERQEAALGELRQALAARQEALLGLAQQALSYARVYAENDDALLEELNRITLPRAPKARKPGTPKASAARDTAIEAPQDGEAVESAEATSPDTSDGADPSASSSPITNNGSSPRKANGRKGRAAAQGAVS